MAGIYKIRLIFFKNMLFFQQSIKARP